VSAAQGGEGGYSLGFSDTCVLCHRVACLLDAFRAGLGLGFRAPTQLHVKLHHLLGAGPVEIPQTSG